MQERIINQKSLSEHGHHNDKQSVDKKVDDISVLSIVGQRTLSHIL